MFKYRSRFLAVSALGTVLALTGCESGNTPSSDLTTTISGKVTLSNVVAGSSSKVGAAPRGKPGTKMYKQSLKKVGSRETFLPSVRPQAAFSNAEVFLYDADHPEWTEPVANTATDDLGNYELSVLENAAANGNAYTDGAAIPKGHYTLIASDYDPASGSIVVAIQDIAQDFAGSVTGNDLEAVPSTEVPQIKSIMGQSKNLDGTETYGSADVTVSPTAKVQVTFMKPMARNSLTGGGIFLTPAETGTWEVSPDWRSATFTPADGSLDPNTEYSVTVKGDDTYLTAAVKNVYGNRLESTATGTFMTTDAADVTAPVLTFSPSGTGIDPTASLELLSDELLDVTRMSLSLTPSLGTKAKVNYKGKNADGKHVYELSTNKGLASGLSYSGSVTGVKDLSGNAASDLSVSFSTSGTVAGGDVTLNADADIASVQLAAAKVFTDWVGAMNERDLAKWLDLTAGHFAMEYNLANGFDSEMDINRDGVYSLKEFSGMLSRAFLMWENCGTTLTGTLVPDANGDLMNIDAANYVADFEFKLSGTSTQGGKDCSEATPEDSLFATVRKISGQWKVEHASEGIDTRNTQVELAKVLKLVGPAEDSVMIDDQNGPPIFRDIVMNDNGTPTDTSDDTEFAAANTPLKFEWQAVDGAASYVFIVMDAKDPSMGMALVMPSDKTTLDFSDPNAMPHGGGDQGGGQGGDTGASGGNTSPNHDVSDDFGFHNEFRPRPGSALSWQIAALGTNTVDMIKNGRNTTLAKDVTAISKLRRILIDGVFRDLNVKVNALTTGSDVGTPVTYNEIYHGYELDGIANHTGEVVIVVTAESFVDLADANAMQSQNVGMLRVDGNIRVQKKLDFDPDTNAYDAVTNPGGVVAATITRNDLDGNPVTLYTYKVKKRVMLSQGWNWVEVFDNAQQGSNPDDVWPSGDSTFQHFQIHAVNGIEPALSIDSVSDDSTAAGAVNPLEGNSWGEHTANTGATAVTITGTLATSYSTNELYVNLWNEELQVNKHQSISVDQTDGSFSVTMDIYHGRNWINVDGNACSSDATIGCTWVTSHLGVETDTGAVYVPPISITSVADTSDATATLTATETFGDFARYDASAVTSNSITISGSMLNFNNPSDNTIRPNYGAGGEGGWKGGDLAVNSDGTFSITLELFNGFNHVHFNDVAGNWYNMEIFTSLGKPVIKPTILTVNGTAYTAPTHGGMGQVSVDTCSVTIAGTAKKGEVRASWRGEDNKGTADWSDDMYYWEEQSVVADDEANAVTLDDGVTKVYPFSLTLPVISGNAKNFVDVNDSSWNWTGVEVSTTNASCAYTDPVMALTSVKKTGGAELTDTDGMPSDNYHSYQPTADVLTVDIAGTSSRPGRSIKVEMNACGSRDIYTATAGTTEVTTGSGTYAWTVANVKLYQGMWNAMVSDGKWENDQNLSFDSQNGVEPVPPINVTSLLVVADMNATTGTAVSPQSSGCGMADYDIANAQYVRIVGTSKATDAMHSYWGGDSGGEFTTDASGNFAFNVHIYQGWNNVWINDPEWNGFGVNMNVQTGDTRPQYIEITSAAGNAVAAGDTIGAGDFTIEGVIHNVPATGATPFKPDWLDAEVWGYNGSTRYSIDPNSGNQTMNFWNNNDGTWGFSFDITIGTHMENVCNPTCADMQVDDETRINVWAGSPDGNHGLEFVLNPMYGGTGHYWKPGMKPKAENPVRLIQNVINSKAKYWGNQ